MSAHNKNEHEFEEFLHGKHAALNSLYQKLPSSEPDKKLDAAILRMARETVNHRSQPRDKKPRWLIAVGSAAGVVLAASVAWRAGSDNWNRPGESALPPSSPAVSGRATNDTIQVRPIVPADTENAPSVQSVTPMAMESSAEKKENAKPSPPASNHSLEPRRDRSGVTEYTLPTDAAGPSPKPPSAPAMRPSTAKSSSDNLEQPSAFPEEQQPTSHAVTSDDWKIEHQQDSLGRSENYAAKAKTAAQTSAAGEKSPTTSGLTDVDRESNTQAHEPAYWIAHIRKLLRERNAEQALAELKRFKQQYPGYKLPPDLREQIGRASCRERVASPV